MMHLSIFSIIFKLMQNLFCPWTKVFEVSRFDYKKFMKTFLSHAESTTAMVKRLQDPTNVSFYIEIC